MARQYGIGLIGTGFMGGIHARAHNLVRQVFPESAGLPVLKMVADVREADGAAAAARFGIPRWTTDWKALVADPEVEIVDICAPPFLHLPITMAAAAAGKPVYCEKPVGRDRAEAEEVWGAIRAAGVRSFVGYNYRWAPAVIYARDLIASGQIGEIRLARVAYLIDFDAGPLGGDFKWRFSAEHGGWGAIGDIGSHAFDMARYLVGEIAEVCGQTSISVPDRRDPALGPDAPRRKVENEDSFAALVRFANGATGVVEGSRVSTGSRADFSFEVTGALGAVRWVLRRMNELQLYQPSADPRQSGFTRIQMAPGHPFFVDFIPSPGQNLGYLETKVIEIHNFLDGLARGEDVSPTIEDFTVIARVLEAVQRREWVTLAVSDV